MHVPIPGQEQRSDPGEARTQLSRQPAGSAGRRMMPGAVIILGGTGRGLDSIFIAPARLSE